MTAMALRLLSIARPNQCEECPTILPAGKSRCYFHDRPPELRTNRPLHERRLEHVREHLRVQDRPFLNHLIEPLSIDEIATRLGPGYTARVVGHSWDAIRASLGLDTTSSPAVGRIELVRVVAGLSKCYCER